MSNTTLFEAIRWNFVNRCQSTILTLAGMLTIVALETLRHLQAGRILSESIGGGIGAGVVLPLLLFYIGWRKLGPEQAGYYAGFVTSLLFAGVLGGFLFRLVV